MNSLSWFLYLADALSGLGITFAVFGGISVIVGAFGTVAWTIANGVLISEKNGLKRQHEIDEWTTWSVLWDAARKYLPLGFLLICIAVLIPSKQTMYAIAASQFGEQIVKNETVQGVATDASKALQEWIRKQIEPSKESKR